MKTIRIIAILLVSFISINKIHSQTATLSVTVNDLPKDEGILMVRVFKEGENIFKDPTIFQNISAKNGITVNFEDLPYGNYVIYIIHDADNNGILNHKWGMPSEAFDYSNDWKLTLFSGMPSFNKTKFTFSEDTELDISLQQL